MNFFISSTSTPSSRKGLRPSFRPFSNSLAIGKIVDEGSNTPMLIVSIQSIVRFRLTDFTCEDKKRLSIFYRSEIISYRKPYYAGQRGIGLVRCQVRKIEFKIAAAEAEAKGYVL